MRGRCEIAPSWGQMESVSARQCAANTRRRPQPVIGATVPAITMNPSTASTVIIIGLSLSRLESWDSRAAKLASQIIAEEVSMNAIDGFVEQGSVDLQ